MLAGGLDPDGNLLDPLMPRYDMDPDDFEALIAFLKRLDSDLDPGLSETAIRIGTLLPRQGGYGLIGQAVDATIRAYFDDINAAGGIFGRELQLVAAEYAGDPAQTAASAPAGHCGARRLQHCGRVHAVDRINRHAVATGTFNDGQPRHVLEGRGHGIAVVLADEDDRHLPDGRQVQGLVKDALVDATVPEEADADGVAAVDPIGTGSSLGWADPPGCAALACAATDAQASGRSTHPRPARA